MYPVQSDAMRMQSIGALRQHYNLPDNVWNAFVQIAGDPMDDMRLLAVLPPSIVSAALERSQLPDGSYLSAVQASHVGLVYNFIQAHTTHPKRWGLGCLGRIIPIWRSTHHGGACGDEGRVRQQRKENENDTDLGPDGRWGLYGADGGDESQVVPKVRPSGGGYPPEEEDPTLEQLSALQKCIEKQDTAPFVDFAIYVPFGQRALKASKFRTFVLTSSGYVTKELPGPANFNQWRTCYRLLKTSLLMLGRSGLSSTTSLRSHNRKIGKKLSHVLAFDIQRGRSCKVGSGEQTEVEAGHGNQGRATTTRWILPSIAHGITYMEL